MNTAVSARHTRRFVCISFLLAIFVKVRGLSTVSIEVVDANGIRRFLCTRRNLKLGDKEVKRMNRLEQAENEKRAWSVQETADFLGFSRNYVYYLIHAGKIDGWFIADKGGYRFCPAAVVKWVRNKMNGNAKEGASGHEPVVGGKTTIVNHVQSEGCATNENIPDDLPLASRSKKGGEAA